MFVGRLPKQSPYHWDKTATDIIDSDYWFNDDLPYKWVSRNEVLKRYNSKLMVDSVNEILENYRYENIRVIDKNKLRTDMIEIIRDYNRKII